MALKVTLIIYQKNIQILFSHYFQKSLVFFFLYYINKVNSIIGKLEGLENEKTNLKGQLKIFEDEFQTKKKNIDQKIKFISKEAEVLDKTINIIKNLKNF